MFVAAWVVALAVAPSSPSATASTAKVVDWYTSHRRAAMLSTYLLDGVAGVSLLAFAAALRGFFRAAAGQAAILPDVLFAAGVAAGTVSLTQAAIGETLANRVAPGGDAATTRALFDLLNLADTFKLLALALLLWVAAAAIVLAKRPA